MKTILFLSKLHVQSYSPINIITSNVLPARRTLPVRTQGADKIPISTEYKNEGHGYSAKVTYADGSLPTISGGPLGRDQFKFFNFHFHWPSEHLIDGKQYAAELHIVHFNTKYATVSEAATKPDGLGVVGVFLEVR